MKNHNKSKSLSNNKITNLEEGFSLIELLVVLAIIAVGSSVSLFYFTAHSKLYKGEDQALKMIDILQLARQYSLTQRQTMRVEFNLTQGAARLIDENLPGNAGDDIEIRKFTLLSDAELKIRRPLNISPLKVPPVSLPCPEGIPVGSVHPSSAAQNAITIRFMRDGTVQDAGVNGEAVGAITRGFTVYVWEPDPQSTSNAKSLSLVKAITITGATGSIQYWSHNNDETGGINNTGWDNSSNRR